MTNLVTADRGDITAKNVSAELKEIERALYAIGAIKYPDYTKSGYIEREKKAMGSLKQAIRTYVGRDMGHSSVSPVKDLDEARIALNVAALRLTGLEGLRVVQVSKGNREGFSLHGNDIGALFKEGNATDSILRRFPAITLDDVDLLLKAVALEEISTGISGIICWMDSRDRGAAVDAVSKYLGKDTLAEMIQEEFDALPASERGAMKERQSYGLYSYFRLVTCPEIIPALSVVARKITSEFNLDARTKGKLQNPLMVEEICGRFPEITREDIRLALA